MVRRAPKRPCVSVILAAHNAGEHLTRAIESVLNQDYEDLELIVANCASSDRTASVCERFVDRDIRVEAVSVDSNAMSCGRTAACSVARGRYLLFVGQDDWLGAGYLDAMVRAAREHDAQMVIPEFSVDTEQPDGSRVFATLSHESCFWDGAEQFHRGAAPFVENGVLAFAAGKLFARECIEAMADMPDMCHNEISFMTGCVRGLSSVAVVEGARYHLLQPSTPAHAAFDPGMFTRCQEDYRRLRDLYECWGLLDDPEAMAAVHRRYLREADPLHRERVRIEQPPFFRRASRPRPGYARCRPHARGDRGGQGVEPRIRHHVRPDRAAQRHGVLYGGAHTGYRGQGADAVCVLRGGPPLAAYTRQRASYSSTIRALIHSLCNFGVELCTVCRHFAKCLLALSHLCKMNENRANSFSLWLS